MRALAHGRGFYRGYNGSTFGVWEKWSILGILSSGGRNSVKVGWPNVWAVKRFRAQSITTAGASGDWR